MDLLFRETDELVVVDFKTDDVTTTEEIDAAANSHSGQAAAYAEAVEQATGLAVREVVFVFARVGVERNLPRAMLATGAIAAAPTLSPS